MWGLKCVDWIVAAFRRTPRIPCQTNQGSREWGDSRLDFSIFILHADFTCWCVTQYYSLVVVLDPNPVPVQCRDSYEQPGMVDTKRKVCEETGCTHPALARASGNSTNNGGDYVTAEQQQGVRKRRCRQHSTISNTLPPTAVSEQTQATAKPPQISSSPSDTSRRRRTSHPTTPQPSAVSQSEVAVISPPLGPTIGAADADDAGVADAVAAVNLLASTSMVVEGAGVVVDNRCEHPGCWRDPVFAGHSDTERWPRFCVVHRYAVLVGLEGVVWVVGSLVGFARVFLRNIHVNHLRSSFFFCSTTVSGCLPTSVLRMESYFAALVRCMCSFCDVTYQH